MSAKRRPLATYLHAHYHERDTLSTKELIALLEKAQLATEELWSRLRGIPEGVNQNCEFQGCNYRRYPASRFCMYHVTGHSTYAASLRSRITRSIKEDQARGVDTTEYDGILRLITENIVKRSHHKKRD